MEDTQDPGLGAQAVPEASTPDSPEITCSGGIMINFGLPVGSRPGMDGDIDG